MPGSEEGRVGDHDRVARRIRAASAGDPYGERHRPPAGERPQRGDRVHQRRRREAWSRWLFPRRPRAARRRCCWPRSARAGRRAHRDQVDRPGLPAASARAAAAGSVGYLQHPGQVIAPARRDQAVAGSGGAGGPRPAPRPSRHRRRPPLPRRGRPPPPRVRLACWRLPDSTTRCSVPAAVSAAITAGRRVRARPRPACGFTIRHNRRSTQASCWPGTRRAARPRPTQPRRTIFWYGGRA